MPAQEGRPAAAVPVRQEVHLRKQVQVQSPGTRASAAQERHRATVRTRTTALTGQVGVLLIVRSSSTDNHNFGTEK